MEKLKATFRIVTPMFLGGAEPKRKAELRVPSIKGALRFWYRATFPKEDYTTETRIFGGSGKEEGQARILLRLSNIQCPSQDPGDPRWHNTQIPYLGYGVINREKTGNINEKTGNPEQKSMTLRPYIMEKSTFILTILFKPPTSTLGERIQQYEEDKIRVQRALWAMTMFGGLGARSRKGFGSVMAVEIQGMNGLPTLQPADMTELQQGINDFCRKIDKIDSSPPEYTAFSTDARCILTGTSNSAMNSFEWLANKIQSLRSHRGSSKLPFVTEDHDDIRSFIENGTAPSKPPKRAAFGLPHNYFFTSINNSRKRGRVDFMDGGKKGRRASPLIFSIHEFGNAEACVIATFLPARLIPENREVSLSGACNDSGCLYNASMPLPHDFTAVTALLNALNGQEVRVHE